ncbi:MAG: DUF3800 domain-containing protein [archaeon]|nr:DUF3800 domain-containing protein [archaeon]
MLKKLRDGDLEIGVVAIEKSFVKQELREQPNILYNYLVVNYMINNLMSRYKPASISLTLDRCLSGSLKAAFDNYVSLKIATRARTLEFPSFSVEHIDSQIEPCLQATDYIAGACFRKFEHDDAQWYELIKDKIQFKTSWGYINW